MAGPVRVDISPRSAVSVGELIRRDPHDRSIDSVEFFQSLVELPFVYRNYVGQSEGSPQYWSRVLT